MAKRDKAQVAPSKLVAIIDQGYDEAKRDALSQIDGWWNEMEGQNLPDIRHSDLRLKVEELKGLIEGLELSAYNASVTLDVERM